MTSWGCANKPLVLSTFCHSMQKALLTQVKAAEFYLHMYRPAHTTDAVQIRYIDTGPTRYLHARAFAY